MKKNTRKKAPSRLSEGMLTLIGLHLTLLIVLLLVVFSKWITPLHTILFGTTCSFISKLHIYCPGCGGTRAISALLHLNFRDSFLFNPIVPIAAFVMLYVDARTVIREIRGRTNPSVLPKLPYFDRYLAILLIATVVLNFLIRNALLIFWGIDPIGDIDTHWITPSVV